MTVCVAVPLAGAVAAGCRDGVAVGCLAGVGVAGVGVAGVGEGSGRAGAGLAVCWTEARPPLDADPAGLGRTYR